jgi:hypothetical protein
LILETIFKKHIMKKVLFNLFLFSGIIASLVSCETATTEPVGSVVKQINAVEPTNGANLILSANFATQPATTIKWNGADFGYSAAVKYTLEIDSATALDFKNAKKIDLGNFNEYSNLVHEFSITHKALNLVLSSLGGAIGIPKSYKLRIAGRPDVQLATEASTDLPDGVKPGNGLLAYSQEVTFTASVYDKFDETFKIYVPGNFGATSTFADWNVDLVGTSNSPVIYTPLNDGMYSGFVWINNPTPQFKFANPDATNLNIKGLDAVNPTVAGLISGTLKVVADINDPSSMTVPVSTANFSGAGTYYVTANLTDNKYTIIKRRFLVAGQAIGAVAKPLDYVIDPNSPYYRMYVNNNITFNAGFFKIGLRTNTPISPASDNLGTPTAGSNQNLVITPNASSAINNKMSIGGGFYIIQNPGTYTVVLDTKNSANYNLRLIPN